MDEDGAILDDFEQLLTRLLSQDSVCDELELWLVGVVPAIYLHRASSGVRIILRQIAVELFVELLPDLFGEAKLAELSEDGPQEALLVSAHLVSSDLDQHGLSLT